MPATQPIIEARGLVKRYGQNVAVDRIDLTVYAGEIFGILGPNGAGKTTTLEMMEGLRAPDAGTIQVAGFDAVRQNAEVSRVIGVQLQSTALFDYLTAAELVALYANLYEVDSSAARVDELLGMMGLLEKRDARVDQLSGGQQQRLSIALALVNRPLIAFLDEPTTGLDPGARRSLWQTIEEIRADGTTVVLTTHYMEEAEILCDRVAIMDQGRIIALDSPRALIVALEALATVQAVVAGASLDNDALRALPGTVSVEAEHGQLALRTANAQQTLTGLLRLADDEGVTLTDLRSSQANLEDVFLARTGRQYAAGDEDEAARASAPQARRRRFGRRAA